MRNRFVSFLILLALCCSMIVPVFAAGEQDFSLSSSGLDFIRRHETFRASTYAVGEKWYIGYGTPCEQTAYPNGIDEAKASELLTQALLPHVSSVNQFLTKHQITATQTQFDALVSFTLSLGTSWMDPSYRLPAHLISGIEKQSEVEIVDSMAVWCHSNGQVKDAYLQRRIDEARLLLYGDYSSKNSPAFYALILDKNGGTLENDTVCYASEKPYGTLPSVSRSGHQFDGWYTKDGKKWSADTTVSEHVRLTARWTAADKLNYTDVKTDDWFYPYVSDLSKSGVINGRTPTSFAPAGTLTYGEAAKLILLAAGHGEQKATGTHWASGYIDFALKQGFLSAAPTKLDAAIQRLSIAQLAAKSLNLPTATIPSPFTDTTDPSVLSLYQAGILEGIYENNVLVYKPDSNITRAEISAIIWRIERYKQNPAELPTPEPKPEEPKPEEPKPEQPKPEQPKPEQPKPEQPKPEQPKPEEPKPEEPKPEEPKPEEPEPDHTNQFQYKDKWLDILPNVPKNPYDAKLFYQSDGFTYYRDKSYNYETGVDVSVYQGKIDWHQVKDAGIDFAIIRVGGRGWGAEGAIYDDTTFEQNMQGALDAGLKVGVYFFSQAISEKEAIEEAHYVLDKIKGYDVTYPVVFDWEIVSNKDARTNTLDADTLSAAANAFCRAVEQAGHHPMIYFNSPCGYLRYDLSKIIQYDFWYAQYYSVPTFYYGFDMWQYTSSGQVPGIPGKVDLNLYWLPKS